MSVTWPATLLPASFALTLSTNQRAHSAPYGGSEQVVDLLNDRWLATLDLPANTPARAAAVDAFINALRGMTGTTAFYHFARPTPRGTIAGSVTCHAASQGASSLTLDATTGQTLLAGDMIGVGGMLLQVQADCAASSSLITVPIVNRLRKAITGGASVTLSQPTATFRLMNKPGVPYYPGNSGTVTLEFAEVMA